MTRLRLSRSILLAFLLLLQQISHGHSLPARYFVRTAAPGSESCRPTEGIEFKQLSVRSKRDCLRQCVGDENCASAAFSRLTSLCLFYKNVLGQDRCLPQEGWTLWNTRKICSSPGSSSSSCRCIGGYYGAKCQKLVTDCRHAKQSGNYPNMGESIFEDILRMRPTASPHDMAIKCHQIYTTRIRVLQRNDHYNFNLTWDDYVRGFGDYYNFLWLGLANLFYLTSSKPYSLVVNNNPGPELIYGNFSIVENVTYTVTVGPLIFIKPSGSGWHDLYTDINGRRFSTFDNYDNADALACVLKRDGGGWWYSGAEAGGCSDYSLTGRMCPIEGSTEDPACAFSRGQRLDAVRMGLDNDD